MKTLAELQAIRDKLKAEMDTRSAGSDSDIKVVVGMATCGIASGARPVLAELLNEVQRRGLKGVKITQTGCIGMCKNEPIVEVSRPGERTVTYIKMTPEKVARVVSEHVVNGNPVQDFMLNE